MFLTLVQTDLFWEEPAANRARFDALLAPLTGATDLVLLPEMFSTGFSMRPEALAEPMDGPTVRWMLAHARRLDAAVAGSIACVEEGVFYNRFVAALPDGTLHTYDKRHRFGMAGEHRHYTAGARRGDFSWRGWRLCPLICYDLRFPVWSRQQADRYDLLLYVANWPERRARHWSALLPARAIENQACVAALNIVGADGNGLRYVGQSGVWDAQGNPVAALGDANTVQTTELSLEELRKTRRELPFLDDADAFVLEP